ncbi:MAG: transcription termination/antitermination NusG family protein, partial [Candidatus Margulisbacteria bacterium]|nr:transcription termination/antitermination NusG family protein [Candidatus Margulisiibacteriota bacterium]
MEEEKQKNEEQPNAEAAPNAQEEVKEAAVPEAAAETAPEVVASPAEAETSPVEVEEPKILGDRKWYVIQALTGQEDKVKQAIELTIQSQGLKDKIFQVLVPTEETVEIKGGKRLEKVKKMFPGYVFLEMILDEESWYQIRQTPGVARFIGTKVKPTPVSDKEMQRVLKQLGKKERLEVSFER